MTLRVLSLCSGVGGLDGGLEGIEHELINYAEIDTYASKQFSKLFNISEEKNLWDVSKIEAEKLEDFDLMVGGFPCTDVSTMGKGIGFSDKEGNKTRTGLIDYFIDIIGIKKPTYVVLENVKGIMNKNHKQGMLDRISKIEELGYNSYYELLNAKYFNSGQHRERYFFVFIRQDKDNGIFKFPKQEEVTKHFCDILEQDVDKKYYLSDRANKIYEGRGKPKQLDKDKRSNNIEYAIKVKFRKTLYDIQGVSPTVIESHGDVIRIIDPKTNKYRKITPREALRLQGFSEDDIDILSEGISDTQIYIRAGNAVCKKVSKAIMNNLLNQPTDSIQAE